MRKMAEINASSMADIAFLLLIFFLVTTTMNVDTGLARMLPQMPQKDQKEEAADVNIRNILLVRINRSDKLLVGGKPMDITQLRDKVKEFLVKELYITALPLLLVANHALHPRVG